jgi:TetR/AcrR family transcriptional regulator
LGTQCERQQMNTNPTKTPRRQQILDAFAHMLEASPGERITTAALAKQVGVSEAALYRHFPSKTKMFEGLIDYIEESIFLKINLVLTESDSSGLEKCGKILNLILVFAEHNPGVTRILTGDALAGEMDRLHQRVVQLFERIDLQLKQLLRDAEVREGMALGMPITATANLWMVCIEGKIAQFVRSQFRVVPTHAWQEQWFYLRRVCSLEETA